MSTLFRFRWAAADWEGYFRSPSEDTLNNWLDKQFHVSVMDYFCNYNVAFVNHFAEQKVGVSGAKKSRARGSILRA